MTTNDEQAQAEALERKAAAVQDASHDIFVATGTYVTGPLRRQLFALYDRAHEEGRQNGIAQKSITADPPLTQKHAISTLPGSVLDRTGSPLPGYGGGRITPDEDYPLRAMCSTCHQPIRCETSESPWEHA
jgi:hypothetical protein